MRETVELAQYQVAIVGAPVDLLYHRGSSESPTYHRARSASYTWGVIRYLFLLLTYIDTMSKISHSSYEIHSMLYCIDAKEL